MPKVCSDRNPENNWPYAPGRAWRAAIHVAMSVRSLWDSLVPKKNASLTESTVFDRLWL
jgi:hypothetical protein